MKTLLRNKFLAIALPLIAFIGLALSSCTIDENLNNSPNAINEAKVKSVDGLRGLIVGLQVAVADFYSGDRSRINSVIVYQMCSPAGLGRPQPNAWNNIGWNETDNTAINWETDGPTDDNWKIAYRGNKIADDIIKYAPDVDFGSDAIRNSFLGIAKTYKALLLGELAAMYGSIPISITGLEDPSFVDFATAMAKVQTLLSESLTHFAAAGAVKQDLNFGGDGPKWIAAVNSLRARYYLISKDYANALTATNSGMTAGSLNGIYTDNANEWSPWGHWTLSEAGEPLRGEKTFVDLLKAEAGDKRLEEYFIPNDGANYWGFAAHGQKGDSNETKLSSLVSMKKYGAYGDDFPLISANENLLIQAECMARAGNAAGAVTNVNVIRKAAGLANFSGSTPAAIITEVLKQKYLTLFLEGQSFYDARRVGVLPSATSPKRWVYPKSEKNANPNTPADNNSLIQGAL